MELLSQRGWLGRRLRGAVMFAILIITALASTMNGRRDFVGGRVRPVLADEHAGRSQ